MFQTLFNIILSILASLIQVIVLPINILVTTLLPDISTKILDLSNSLTTLFSGITWGLGLIPLSIKVTLLFIISVEVARHTIFVSTHVITRIFDIIRRLKFW